MIFETVIEKLENVMQLPKDIYVWASLLNLFSHGEVVSEAIKKV